MRLILLEYNLGEVFEVIRWQDDLGNLNKQLLCPTKICTFAINQIKPIELCRVIPCPSFGRYEKLPTTVITPKHSTKHRLLNNSNIMDKMTLLCYFSKRVRIMCILQQVINKYIMKVRSAKSKKSCFSTQVRILCKLEQQI